MEYKYLNNIDSPSDLKKLPVDVLPELCGELRDFIIQELSHNPGHLGSSLGAIEIAVAVHYVFDTPYDKVVWDVGHQAYAHKILTGRRERFHTNRQFKGLAPFPTPAESEYDAFIAGHASNSISAALGIEVGDCCMAASGSDGGSSEAVAGEVSGVRGSRSKPHVVAVIGDGAMTGGLAFEGLNNASMTKNDLLIILNDNNMAIDPLKGGFTQYLVDITTSKRYNKWRWKLYQMMMKLHLMDEHKTNAVRRFSTNLKTILTRQPNNIFQGLNLRYFGPADGHSVVDLVRILKEIKDHRGPKVLHLITKKGKGYAPAENDQTTWHAPGEFNAVSGKRLSDSVPSAETESAKVPPLWQEVFGETLLELARENSKITGVTPAMPSGCSMSIMQKELPERVFDVGIAEGHAVTFSAGLASTGVIPFCNIYSSFLQRAYDNIIHDVALPKQHVVLCIDRAGIVGNDGATHHGLFDLAYLRPIPNLAIAAPRTADDLRELMRLAVDYNGPIAIRYPRGRVSGCVSETEREAVTFGKGVCLREGKGVAVLSIGAIGNTVAEAIAAAEETGTRSGDFAHYDMRWLKPIDTGILDYVGNHFGQVVTVEDSVISGGLGSAVLEYFAEKGYNVHVTRLGVNDQFVEHGSTKELYRMLRLDKEGICESLLQVPAK